MNTNTMLRWISAGSLLAVFAATPLPSAKAAEAFVYDDRANYSGYIYPNGSASSVSGNTMTFMVTDDITPVPEFAGQSISNIYFAVVNRNTAAVSTRFQLRMWDSDGALGGPGTLMAGYTLGPASIAANTAKAFSFHPTGLTVPTNTFWLGLAFDNATNTTGATAAQLNNLWMLIYDPAVIGFSDDVFFGSTNADYFLANNPNGVFSYFGGSPKASFYWAMSASVHIAATPQTLSIQQGKPLSITLAAVDNDGDPLTYAIVAPPTNGTLTGTAPNVVYHPNPGYYGADAFTFKASDATTSSIPALVSINVLQGSAGLVINPIWDTTILSDPNVTNITNAITVAIRSLQSRFSDIVTANVLFAEMGSGLGMSQTYIAQIPYSTYYSALVADSKTTNDTIALAHVPGGATDPVHGGANVTATLPNLRALGITVNSTTNYDSIVYFNNQPGLFNYTRPPVDPNAYDLQATITHELDEVLGTSSGVGQTYIHPPDLFRYTAAHARTFTTAGDDAWFSIDAANNLVQYNQDAGGDYGDWWSVTTPAVPRVQDAFATQGATPDLAEELLVLDVIGWDLAAAVPQLVTAPAAVVHASKSGNTLNLSWASVTNRNYQVQMRTNLTAGAWANLGSPILATTTTTTYSDTPLSDKTRFYRVVSLPSNPPSPPPAFAAAGQIVTGPFELSTHVLNPRPGAAPAPPQGNLKRFGPINLASPEAIQGNRVDN